MKSRGKHYRIWNDQERLLLTQRNGIYYLRWCLSDHMARILWTEELRCSLRTRNERLAQYMRDIIEIQIAPHLRAAARGHQQGIYRDNLRTQLKIALKYMITDMLEDQLFMSAAKWQLDGGKLNEEYADLIPYLSTDNIPNAFYAYPPYEPKYTRKATAQ